MSRALDETTQNLITDLCQLLSKHPTAALRSLEVAAPVLIERLEQVKIWGVDRREMGAQIDQQLRVWLKDNPQPVDAKLSLLSITETVCPMFSPRREVR
ncbi:hypothetical protein ALP68_200187 [Pseudomonas ficuserectae]|nr:hypothetical protein ALO69_200075 [Pseudomonas ficuserectae]RMP45684.1 hypothetical protein ALQ23_200031 [Pseudomonas syringae pv. antirrhini]RMS29244.1 hypothetical protein ALP68_200187 [Pseudomonas ficuserectae]RMW25660.1 hypothetical protein ALO95_200459 [Pseudomonas syringae pv. antirrhini]